MPEQNLIGTMALIKTGRLYDTWDICLEMTKQRRAAFEKDPEGMMTEFLRKRGFNVNSMRFLRKRSSGVQRKRDIDILGARHAHSGSSKSGWV